MISCDDQIAVGHCQKTDDGLREIGRWWQPRPELLPRGAVPGRDIRCGNPFHRSESTSYYEPSVAFCESGNPRKEWSAGAADCLPGRPGPSPDAGFIDS